MVYIISRRYISKTEDDEIDIFTFVITRALYVTLKIRSHLLDIVFRLKIIFLC